jgi:hypothetical protein
MDDKYYLNVAYASDLKNKKERWLYRFFEILPGLISWSTLLLALLLSYFAPLFISFFTLIFVAYWFFRAAYFSFYIRAGYRRMRECENTNWLKKLDSLNLNSDNVLGIKDWKELYQIVVLPMYNEPYKLVRDSIQGLADSRYPNNKLIVVLTQEEKGGEESFRTGEKIKKEFSKKFFKLIVTQHPYGLPGEIMGKASNEVWACRKVKDFIDQEKIDYKKVIFSSFDIDTVSNQGYFGCLSYHYLTTKKPLRTSYQPVALFLNNVWQAPALSRLFSFSTSFWHITNQERQEKLITFSSHSMPFNALVDIGFKRPDIVSDDSHIFWHCLLFYDGDYRVEPLLCPVSMDTNIDKTFFKTLKNVYKQQKRWAYGASEIAYFLFGFLKNKKISLKRKFALSFEVIEGHWNWACAPILLAVLGWLPSLLGGHEFNQTLLSYNLPRFTGKFLTIAMIGLFSYMYYTFYLLPPKKGKNKWWALFASLQWIFFPITMMFFVSLPALDAQTRLLLGKYMGFWPTPKYR